MKTLFKLGAAAALVAVFASAFAGEATIDEIVVIGKRPSEALPQTEIARPAMPQIKLDPIVPVISLPRIEIATLEPALGRAALKPPPARGAASAVRALLFLAAASAQRESAPDEHRE